MAKRYNDGYYEGRNNTKKQAARDGSMLNNDSSAIAFLPQNVMIKAYPDPSDYLSPNLDDTITGIDRQRGKDHSQMMQNLKPQKY